MIDVLSYAGQHWLIYHFARQSTREDSERQGEEEILISHNWRGETLASMKLHDGEFQNTFSSSLAMMTPER